MTVVRMKYHVCMRRRMKLNARGTVPVDLDYCRTWLSTTGIILVQSRSPHIIASTAAVHGRGRQFVVVNLFNIQSK